MGINEALTALNLQRPVTFQEIRKAYRTLALKYHPDKPGGSSAQFIKIDQACKFLLSKTEAEINNIHSFKVAPKGSRGPIIIPDSLLFGDAENLFYIGHFLYKIPVLRTLMHFIYHLTFLPKQSSNTLKLLQVIIGLMLLLCLFPFILATLMLLALPYLLYELFYEWFRSLYFKKHHTKLSKYSHKPLEKFLFMSVRLLPALAISGILYINLSKFKEQFHHILFDMFTLTTYTLLAIWMLSVIRDIYISLNQKGETLHRA